MEILFLTGMSGAGKSAAVRYLEDCGYFCMDNVPPYVLPDLVKSFLRGRNGEGFSTPKLAFVVDIRSQEYLTAALFPAPLIPVRNRSSIIILRNYPPA